MQDRLARTRRIIETAVDAGEIPAAVLLVRRDAETVLEIAAGDAPDPDSVFLIASIAKPIVCTGAALLLERGEMDLDDRVGLFAPDFVQNGKQDVRLRHLFTHISGLPDMLPENEELRRREAPLSDFVDGVCRQPLLFAPGTKVSYQSTGILMLAEIMERITGTRLRTFLKSELFDPIGMDSTSLGWSPDLAKRVIDATSAPDSEGSWVWNTPYWRELGAPWGGMFSTAADLSKLLSVFLDRGMCNSKRILEPPTVRLMLTDHTRGVPAIGEMREPQNGWGLGWRIQRAGGHGFFGSLTPPGSFGHGGATGTLAWADPASKCAVAILTNGNMPGARMVLERCSNTIAAAICDRRFA